MPNVSAVICVLVLCFLRSVHQGQGPPVSHDLQLNFVPSFSISFVSLIQSHQRRGPTTSTWSISILLIALSGDTQLNPGPCPKFPCGSCGKGVRSNQKALCCDHCDQWFHTRCVGMSDHIYELLLNISPEEAHNYSFHCPTCGLRGLSSSLFSDATFNFSDSESVLDSSNSPSSPFSDPGSPVFTSSPRPKKPTSSNFPKTLRSLTINFQSIMNKIPSLLHLIETTKPDVIFGSETWLSSVVRSSEIFPANFNIYRHDRSDGYGGALIAVSYSLISSEIQLESPGGLLHS